MILNHAIDFDGIYFTNYWKWWITAPLFSIIILVLSFAFIGKEIENFLIYYISIGGNFIGRLVNSKRFICLL